MHDLKDFRGATKILITKQNCFLCFSGTFLQCSFLLYSERQRIAINHYILSYSCMETPAGRVDILMLIMNTLHICRLLIIISLFNFNVICPFSRLRL